MATNKCSYCGALIPSGNRYCPNCGKPFIVSRVNTSQAAPPPPAAAPPVAPPPAAVPTAPPPAAARPVATQQVPYVAQQPQVQMTNAGTTPYEYEPKKKSNGVAVAIAIILSLAVLAGCGWAVYEFLIKDGSSEKQEPSKEKVESGESGASEAVSQEASKEASTPETKANIENDDEYFKFEDEEGVNNSDSPTDDISQGLENEGNKETAPRTTQAPKTASSQKTVKKPNTQRRYSGEPMGMTDEEAAQMGRYSGEPMGMTDEEAAMMRRMNKRRR